MLLNDLRYALRRLAETPAWVAAFALGIGANSNIFRFVDESIRITFSDRWTR